MLRGTSTLNEVADHCWDVVVVGAGPAGALAARCLARLGVAVLLVDKAVFPRYKICGACLNQSSLAVLGAVGLGDLPARLGAVPLSEIELSTAGRQARLALPGGVALSRQALDAALVEAAEAAGARFLAGTEARLAGSTPALRQLRLRRAHCEVTVETRVLVAADGLGRLLSGEQDYLPVLPPPSRLGAGVVGQAAAAGAETYRRGVISMACGRQGYVGLVRLEDDRLDLAAALEPALVRQQGGLGHAAAAVLGEAGLPIPSGLADWPWRGTPRLSRRASRPAGHRVFLIGDAAGYVEPFTGEGIAWALGCGVAVAPWAYQGCRQWDRALTERWCAEYRRTIARRQWVCCGLAWLLRRPALLAGLVSMLSRFPGLAAPVVWQLNRPP